MQFVLILSVRFFYFLFPVTRNPRILCTRAKVEEYITSHCGSSHIALAVMFPPSPNRRALLSPLTRKVRNSADTIP